MSNRINRNLPERELQRDVEISRNNANTSTALLFSVFIVAIAALGAAFFLSNRQAETQAPENQSPDINIEVPQREAPQVQPPEVNVQPPDVNINVPELEAPTAPEGSTTQQAPLTPEGDATQQAPAQSGSPEQ
ncbi:MAG: hypothetical protein Kow00121_02610 [Elainellaceae cyanobacterium]